MDEYLVPAHAGENEFTEKKSRFIGRVWPVATEEEAIARIQEVKKKHYDARHNCWAYILKDGAVRYSDDGEPGGTAGVPILQVLQKEGLYNVVCVVTRYFGGVLLGAGGLVRAYTKGAKIAVDAAEKSKMCQRAKVFLPCPYAYYDQAMRAVADFDGIVTETTFDACVYNYILLEEANVQPFLDRIRDLSRGEIKTELSGWVYTAVPVK